MYTYLFIVMNEISLYNKPFKTTYLRHFITGTTTNRYKIQLLFLTTFISGHKINIPSQQLGYRVFGRGGGLISSRQLFDWFRDWGFP